MQRHQPARGHNSERQNLALMISNTAKITSEKRSGRLVNLKNPAALKGNTTLFIANNNEETEKIALKVMIDGKTVVNQIFYKHLLSPNYCYFDIDLQPGTHRIRIERSDNGYVFEEKFVSAVSNGAIIRYTPSHFVQFDFYQNPEA